ncbi:hypothetical protein HHI36_022398 [Cryptolaemus montrouzieri]|uniref:Uncharacterized protein n=1 Tax=Cryptolaemus montrouzieri TaxID=559131 RepID=A0ABD2MZR7_9CUCU
MRGVCVAIGSMMKEIGLEGDLPERSEEVASLYGPHVRKQYRNEEDRQILRSNAGQGSTMEPQSIFKMFNEINDEKIKQRSQLNELISDYDGGGVTVCWCCFLKVTALLGSNYMNIDVLSKLLDGQDWNRIPSSDVR